MPIKWACDAFRISETCYRYEAKLKTENEEIMDWLIRLTDNNRNWGFGLCFLYLRNICVFRSNWTLIPPQTDQQFHGKLDSHSSPT